MSVMQKIKKRNLETPTARILGLIDSLSKRFGDFIVDINCFSFAQFTIDDTTYHVTIEGNIYYANKFTNYEWTPCTISYVKDGIYPAVTISGVSLLAYQVVLAALNPDFYEKYAMDSRLVVNHLLIEPYAISHRYTTTSSRPIREFNMNPYFLEVITRGENTKHGRFVEKYGLWGISVKYSEISILAPLLQQLPEDTDFAEYVAELYKDDSLNDPRDFREFLQ
jgi:hypothetical protein